MMRPLRILAAASVVLVAACSPAPEKAVREFYGHIDKGNAKDAIALVDPEVRQFFGGKINVAIGAAVESYKACGGVKSIDLKPVKGDGDKKEAVVYETSVKFRSSECKTSEKQVAAVKIDGKWYVRF